MKKIAIVLPDLRGGGAERMHINLASEWIALGYQVDFILLSQTGELLKLVPEKSRIISLDCKNIFKACPRLIKVFKEEAYDIVIGVMWPISIITILAGKCVDTKIVVSDHNTLSKSYKALNKLKFTFLRLSVRFIYPLANLRRVVSKGIGEDLANLSGLDKQSFEVVYNPAFKDDGVSTKKLCSNNSKKLKIIAVGSLKHQKNFALLIDAVAGLPSNFPYELSILGEGSLRKELESKIDALALNEKVKLLGFVKDPKPFYEQSDLFILSSDYEGFGNVIVEAMSLGCQVISSDCKSGPREILSDGEYGQLFPVGDKKALTDLILSYQQNVISIDKLYQRAKCFSAKHIAKVYIEKILKA
ncbi:glycosyltransferase [Thalassotalea aquiviva]|uniref:glycosyltransferase n=1 Tax=Thalassotalea aquiviva TaxID=3242415 RepID=UPI003529E479